MNAATPQPPLVRGDWNFDSIPDHHLIACCYWEYARESTFLREFKSRCVEANRSLKPLRQTFELCGQDARRVLAIGSVANSFLLGFGFPSGSPPSTLSSQLPVSGNFPAPWQSLSPAERDYRALLAAGPMPPDTPPFQRASGPEAINALLFL
ncbi:MAG TPA: hypothetical protein VNZ22_02985, partial [Bacillota bacterium]|nr:hypothetical protein [Bacillota bacterium]